MGYVGHLVRVITYIPHVARVILPILFVMGQKQRANRPPLLILHVMEADGIVVPGGVTDNRIMMLFLIIPHVMRIRAKVVNGESTQIPFVREKQANPVGLILMIIPSVMVII